MRRAVDGIVAGLAGTGITVSVIAVVHDLAPSHPSRTVSWTLTIAVFTAATAAVASPVARIVGSVGRLRVLAALIGAVAATAWVAAPPLALLGPDTSTAARLAWMMGEEDNAQIVGVAREVIQRGPGGGDLAEQFGTGFVVVATTADRMLGLGSDGVDPRVLAIGTFTASVVAAVILLGLTMLLVSILGAAPFGPARHPVAPGVTAVLTGATVAGAVAAALGVAVVLPMRTGFLSFVWAFVWAALGLALLPILLRSPSRPAVVAVVIHVIAAGLLLMRTWPFLLAVFLPAVALLLRRAPWRALRAGIRDRPGIAAAVTMVAVAATGLLGRELLSTGALAEVLSYGREAFTAVASGIAFDDRIVAAAGLAAALLATRSLLRRRSDPGDGEVDRMVLALGPTAGVLASWLALRVVAEFVADGEFNYAGTKLLYGVVAIAAVTLLPAAAAGWMGRRRLPTVVGAISVAGMLLLAASSPTVRTLDEWEARLAPSEPPHAVAVVTAIDRTTPELPVRCRPTRGTTVTPTSRWAAYFCVRWVEDALNQDRSQAFRDDFLQAPDGTFDPIVAEAAAEGLYGFAYVMDLGPGWFGWDGRS